MRGEPAAEADDGNGGGDDDNDGAGSREPADNRTTWLTVLDCPWYKNDG